jgi:hypothetical protein
MQSRTVSHVMATASRHTRPPRATGNRRLHDKSTRGWWRQALADRGTEHKGLMEASPAPGA